MKKYVYAFKEGNATMRNLLGGKGANLAEMTSLGLPIPQGFTVSTEACTEYYNCGKKISSEIEEQIFSALRELEEIQGKKFGDESDPLLVSVRSGARASMPGMMDTILNLGLNDKSVEGFALKTGNPRFAYDSYRRFIQMYSDVVMEVNKSFFEKIIDELKEEKGIKYDTEMTVEDLKELVNRFKSVYSEHMGGEEFPQDANVQLMGAVNKNAMNGEDFPQEPKEQLMGAVKAVFRSWDNPRAIVYRRMNDIPGDWGTAVNVQAMVFGNMGDTSGTGVAFTRNPSTGEKGIYGEYLINAQGEDVVAGVRTPQPITKLAEDMPECFEEFMAIATKLENHYRDMQDMEFTIQEGKLYFLQTRNGKRTASAAINIACDLVDEGMITPQEAIERIDAKSLDLNDIDNKYDNEPTYNETLFKWTSNHDEIGIIADETKYPLDSNGHYIDDNDRTLFNYFLNEYNGALNNIEEQSFVGGKYHQIVLLTIATIGISFAAGSLIVCLLFPLIAPNFKTLGKLITKLIVLNDEGYKYTRLKYLLRYLFLLFVEIIGGILTIGGILLISYTAILSSKKRRSLHDLACGSVVADELNSIFFKDKETELAFKRIYDKENPKKEDKTDYQNDGLVLDLDKIIELRKGIEEKDGNK